MGTIGKCKKLWSFFVLKIFRHLPFLPNLDHLFRAQKVIKLARKIMGSRAI